MLYVKFTQISQSIHTHTYIYIFRYRFVYIIKLSYC